MPITWPEIGAYVAPIALGGASGFLSFLFLLPSKLGDRLVGHHFERRLAELRHEQTIELGKLQSNLDHFKDRGLRSNEREYVATQQVWETFVDAYRNTISAVAQFYQYPDLDRMPEEDVTSFLDSNQVTNPAKSQIERSQSKTRAFGNYLGNKSINDAGRAIEAVRKCLFYQSVFIPAPLHDQFEKAIATLNTVYAEQRMKIDIVPTEMTASIAIMGREGDLIIAELRDAVRKRLLKEM